MLYNSVVSRLRRVKERVSKHRRRWLLLFFIFLASCVMVGVALFALAFIVVSVPELNDFSNRAVAESTKIYDETGTVLLWEIHGEERRTIVPFDKISLHVKNATIAIEDSSFYTHRGVRPLAIFRAFLVDLFTRQRQGGSTITQQLVKNALLTPDRTLARKIKEIIIALKLETLYSKDEILNLYFNQIPYGSDAYGIEAATQTYFGKSSENLSLAESAYLAALVQRPSYYSPYGNHRAELDERKNSVLARMNSLGFIDQKTYSTAQQEKVLFAPQRRQGIRAPHFVMYVRELLNEKYGEDVVERGGLRVITTLDARLQEKAEEIASRGGKEIQNTFNASNISFVAIEPRTGRILAMVGSRDYFDIAHDGNFNVALAHRQPGSAFKPIVYATAFKKGYTPDTVVFDLETNFAASGNPYIPHNYDNIFRGPVTFRNALAQSLNVPAVKVLYLAGASNVITTAEDLGISSLTDPARYGLTLVLGGGEVSLLELSSAYGVFANQGTRVQTHSIIEVRDRNNTVLEQELKSSRVVLDENVANTITDILSDNAARTPAFGARSAMYFENNAVAVKTGTTNDYRDVWTIGYSPTVVVGAWAGNNDNTPMVKNVAGFIIAPLWRQLMDATLEQRNEINTFTPPRLQVPSKPVLRGIWKGSRTYVTDKVSGKLATEFTPLDQREEHIIQQIHSILYWVSKDNPDGSIPTNPEQDPQFINWERPVRAWAEKQGLKDDSVILPITEYDTTHSPENWPQVTMDMSLLFTSGKMLTFEPKIQGTYSITEINIFIDGVFIKSERANLQTFSLDPSVLNLEPGEHTLTLTVYDSVENRQQKDFIFIIEAP